MEKNNVIDFNGSEIKKVFNSASFKWKLVTLLLLLIGNISVDIYKAYYDSAASLTYLYGFFHVLYEWIIGIIVMLIIFRLVLFIRKIENDTLSAIKSIQKAGSLLFILMILTSITLGFLFVSEGQFVKFILVVGLTVTYFMTLIKYLNGWARFLSSQDNKLPSSKILVMILVGFSVILVYHYFYVLSGGNYGIEAFRSQYYIYTWVVKIILLLLIQTDIILIITSITNYTSKDSIRTLASFVYGGLVIISIILIGYTESGINHYRYSDSDYATHSEFLDNDMNPIGISINNKNTSINPIVFRQVPDLSPDFSTIPMFLDSEDYSGMIPEINSDFIVTLNIDDDAVSSNTYVYDETGNRILDIREWYQLNRLDSGKYYVIVTVSVKGDPYWNYGYYLFILNVD